MKELVRLFVQIAFMRKGPQDLPNSVVLLLMAAFADFIINFLVTASLPGIVGPWIAQLIGEVAFTFAWYALLLKAVRRPERFVQTTTAVFGYQAVLSPLRIGVVWLVRQSADDVAWQFPIAVIGLAIVVWIVAANARILKAALEWPMPACVLLVVMQTLVEEFLLIYLLPGTG